MKRFHMTWQIWSTNNYFYPRVLQIDFISFNILSKKKKLLWEKLPTTYLIQTIKQIAYFEIPLILSYLY